MIMKDFDLRAFRQRNGIQQKELAEYLGVRSSFLSAIESGKRPLPDSALEKIKANPEWELNLEKINLEVSGDSIQQNGGNNNIGKIEGNAEVLALRKEVELLRSINEELKAEKAEYWRLIKELTAKQ